MSKTLIYLHMVTYNNVKSKSQIKLVPQLWNINSSLKSIFAVCK